eukprot:14121836-Alexandrium_andersonii.AAC.1
MGGSLEHRRPLLLPRLRCCCLACSRCPRTRLLWASWLGRSPARNGDCFASCCTVAACNRGGSGWAPPAGAGNGRCRVVLDRLAALLGRALCASPASAFLTGPSGPLVCSLSRQSGAGCGWCCQSTHQNRKQLLFQLHRERSGRIVYFDETFAIYLLGARWLPRPMALPMLLWAFHQARRCCFVLCLYAGTLYNVNMTHTRNAGLGYLDFYVDKGGALAPVGYDGDFAIKCGALAPNWNISLERLRRGTSISRISCSPSRRGPSPPPCPEGPHCRAGDGGLERIAQPPACTLRMRGRTLAYMP